jgi:hypothetical protein
MRSCFERLIKTNYTTYEDINKKTIFLDRKIVNQKFDLTLICSIERTGREKRNKIIDIANKKTNKWKIFTMVNKFVAKSIN